MASRLSRLEELAEDFLASAGRPIVSLKEASEITGWGATNLRAEIKSGLLIAARLSPKGDVRFSCRELARWYLSKERVERKGPKKL